MTSAIGYPGRYIIVMTYVDLWRNLGYPGIGLNHSHPIVSRPYNRLKTLVNFSCVTVCSGRQTVKKLRC